MFGKLGNLWGNRTRAWLGAVCFHLLAGLTLLTVTFEPLPPRPVEVMSIELVDMPAAEPADEIVPVEEVAPSIEEPEPVAPVPPPAPEPEPAPPEPEPEPAPSAPVPAPSEPPIIAVAPPPAPPAQPEARDEDETEDPIPPQYVIRRDPMLEIAPSGAARVSASIMCARTNRETRPAFCPEIDDEDIRFAELARAQGDFGGYNPAGETLFAQSTLNRFALEPGYRSFRDRQESFRSLGSTGGSPIVRSGMKTRRHAEALENCTPVNTGMPRVGGAVSGLTPEVSNGSDVFCD